jgi:hypothetical protein
MELKADGPRAGKNKEVLLDSALENECFFGEAVDACSKTS